MEPSPGAGEGGAQLPGSGCSGPRPTCVALAAPPSPVQPRGAQRGAQAAAPRPARADGSLGARFVPVPPPRAPLEPVSVVLLAAVPGLGIWVRQRSCAGAARASEPGAAPRPLVPLCWSEGGGLLLAFGWTGRGRERLPGRRELVSVPLRCPLRVTFSRGQQGSCWSCPHSCGQVPGGGSASLSSWIRLAGLDYTGGSS